MPSASTRNQPDQGPGLVGRPPQGLGVVYIDDHVSTRLAGWHFPQLVMHFPSVLPEAAPSAAAGGRQATRLRG